MLREHKIGHLMVPESISRTNIDVGQCFVAQIWIYLLRNVKKKFL